MVFIASERHYLCVDHIEVAEFSFGSSTPYIKRVHVYECVDGVGGGKRPVAWPSVMQRFSTVRQTGTCKMVLELLVDIQSDDFILVLRSHLAGKW